MIISIGGHGGAAGTSTALEPATTSEDSEPESAAGVLILQPGIVMWKLADVSGNPERVRHRNGQYQKIRNAPKHITPDQCIYLDRAVAFRGSRGFPS